MGSILFDIEGVKKSAARLEELAAELNKIVETDLEPILSSQAWKGDTGQQFHKKVQQMTYKVYGHSKNLKAAAKGLNTAATVAQHAEEAISNMFKS